MRPNARLVKVTNDPGQVGNSRRAHQVVQAAHVIDELLLTDPAAGPADPRLSPVNHRLMNAVAVYPI